MGPPRRLDGSVGIPNLLQASTVVHDLDDHFGPLSLDNLARKVTKRARDRVDRVGRPTQESAPHLALSPTPSVLLTASSL
jgi:hypothetical protein